MGEVFLCLTLFTACALHVRLRLKNAAHTASLSADTAAPNTPTHANPAA
jgi:hypothetical protein